MSYKDDAAASRTEKMKRYADGGAIRSESTEAYKASRALRRTPQVTVMDDFIGRMSPAKAQDNAFREAITERDLGKLRATGYDHSISRKKD